MNSLSRALKYVFFLGLIVLGGCSANGANDTELSAESEQALSFLDRGIYASGDGWEQSRAAVEEKISLAQTPDDLIRALRPLVRLAGGAHSDIVSATDDRASDVGQTEPDVASEGGVAIVTIPGDEAWMVPDDERHKAVQQIAREIVGQHPCGAIIDLRLDTGGSIDWMIIALSPLLPEGKLLSFISDKGSSVVEVDSVIWAEHTYHQRDYQVEMEALPGLDIPVAILIGPSTGSAGEMTALALTSIPRSRTLGLPTAGMLTYNQHQQFEGFKSRLSTAYTLASDGQVYGYDPIIPDTRSNFSAAIPDALSWLSTEGCE